MSSARFKLALERIQSSEWRLFEELASEFLVVDYPTLRTTASPSGDGGRDGELFVLDGRPDTGFQYSVRKDWATKIRETQTRLRKTFPNIRKIIYVTNQVIGAGADGLKNELWEQKNIALDVLDQSYFLEREATHPQRQAAAEELARKLVDPLLSASGIVDSVAQPLTEAEGRLALLHLTLDRRDDDNGRNLTKSCFDSLVLSALHGTDAETLRTKEQIRAELESVVHRGESRQVEDLIDSALTRLSARNGPVKFNRSKSGYHISFQEAQRIKEQTAGYLLDEEALVQDLLAGLWGLNEQLDSSTDNSLEEAQRLKGALEGALMRQGESFAAAVETGDTFQLDEAQVSSDLEAAGYRGLLSPQEAARAILRVLDGASDATRNHLRRVIDAYTLFAFLKATPDVQRTMAKVFSEGDIWLDTTAVLPLIAELLVTEEDERHYTMLFRAARGAGLKLHVTPGVIEEVASHLHRCETVAERASGEVTGDLPFVYGTYVLSGRNIAEFSEWLQDIRGNHRPEYDIREFLSYHFGIEEKSLKELADRADVALRGAIQELWYNAHDRRRGQGNLTDPGTVARLVAHDVENTVGVIMARRQTPDSPLGYRAWWLTLDRTALRLQSHLKQSLGDRAPHSPALSPDFLARLLRIGPLRVDVQPSSLPIATQIVRFESAPAELLSIAEETRAKYSGMPELRIRREVRDALDLARTAMGPESQGGAHLMEERLQGVLARQRSPKSSPTPGSSAT